MNKQTVETSLTTTESHRDAVSYDTVPRCLGGKQTEIQWPGKASCVLFSSECDDSTWGEMFNHFLTALTISPSPRQT